MFKIFSLVLFNNTIDEIKSYLECFENAQNFRVLIINNGKPNLVIENYLKSISFCSYIQSDSNTGFGGGHNQLLNFYSKEIPSESLLFISNLDIKFKFNDLKEIETSFQDKNVVGLNPRILNVDRTPQKIHYFKPDPWSQFRFKFLRNTFFNTQYEKDYFLNEVTNKTTDVELLSGCFLVTRFKDFQLVNGFNTDYFLYFEDWDLSQKLARLGKLILQNNLEIIHYHKSEANFKIKPFIFFISSFLRFHLTWRSTAK